MASRWKFRRRGAIERIFRGTASFSKVSGERRNIRGDKETAKQYISFGNAGVSEPRLLRAFVTVSYFRRTGQLASPGATFPTPFPPPLATPPRRRDQRYLAAAAFFNVSPSTN